MKAVFSHPEVDRARRHRIADSLDVGPAEMLADHLRPVAVRAPEVALVREPDAEREDLCHPGASIARDCRTGVSVCRRVDGNLKPPRGRRRESEAPRPVSKAL